jgi:hypothetical protein
MDLKYFQCELNKCPIKRRSDYCKKYTTKKSTLQSPKALTDSTITKNTTADDKELDFWEYVKSKLEADNLQLSALEKKNFLETLRNGHTSVVSSKLNLEDLEVWASVCAE